jgi:hypothetical protein
MGEVVDLTLKGPVPKNPKLVLPLRRTASRGMPTVLALLKANVCSCNAVSQLLTNHTWPG